MEARHYPRIEIPEKQSEGKLGHVATNRLQEVSAGLLEKTDLKAVEALKAELVQTSERT